MHKDYLTKLLQLEEFIIDKIDFGEFRITVRCHPKKRGMWHNGEYSEALSTSRLKTARHMIMENKVVFLEVTQRKFFSECIRRGYGRKYPVLNRVSMILPFLDKTASGK